MAGVVMLTKIVGYGTGFGVVLVVVVSSIPNNIEILVKSVIATFFFVEIFKDRVGSLKYVCKI